MDEVELVEEDWAEPVAASPTSPRPRRAPVPLGRLLRRWWPVPVALCSALVLADLATGSAEEQSFLRAQQLPWVAAPIGPEITVAEADPAQLPWAGELVAGVLVSTTWDDQGRSIVIGADPGTGDELWRIALVSEPGVDNSFSSADCWQEEDDLVCWSALTRYDTAGDIGLSQERLIRLDPVDGTRLADRVLPADTVVTGDGALRYTATGRGGPVTLTAVRPDGTLLWSTELAPPPSGRGPSDQLSLDLSGSALVVRGPSGGWAVDPDDGRTILTGATVWESRPGRFVAQEEGHLWAAGDAGRVDLGTGDPLLLGVDDGSVPHAQFVANQFTSRLLAVDIRTGEQLWASEQRFVNQMNVLLIDRTLIGAIPGGVLAVDAASGRERWRAEIASTDTWSLQPVTDGRQVLVLDTADDAARLVALDLRTGAEEWTAEVPPDSQQLGVYDHRLFLYGETRTSLLS